MKTVFIFNLALLGLALRPASARADAPRTDELAAIVAYVVADYPGAVKDGRVLAESEYAEQRGLLDEAAQLAAALPELAPGHRGRLVAAVGAMRDAVAGRKADRDVADAGRRVRGLLLEEWGLVLAPTSAPSRERAALLFEQGCARCHGRDGRADTDEARKLVPPPVSFHDPGRMHCISPELAFHALTFGVKGTGMASFDTLPTADRWSLAFHVIALRHRGGDAARGAKIVAARAPAIAQSASRLAALSDDELAAALGPMSEGDRAAALAYLRDEATFRTDPGGRFAVARARLGELAAAADDRERARGLAIAAYLDGVEPHEAALKANEAGLAARLERAFLELRQAIEAGVTGEALRREVARTTLVLDAVEERAGGRASVPFAAAFAIALREGFELSLLLAALLAFLRRAGRPDDARFVHLGWIAAVPAGVVTWFAIGAALSGARRELTEGVLTLVAAAMLLFVSHFVLGRLESRRWLKFLERRTLAAGARAGGVGAALFSVAFVAAFREAIEIVLFFKALLLDSTSGPWPVVGGAAAGIGALALGVVLLGRLGRRLDPRPLMLVSGVVLTVLAISLVGQGVRALQEGGFVGLTAVAAPSLPALGLYATAQGLLAQAVVLVLVVVPTLLDRRAAATAPRRS